MTRNAPPKSYGLAWQRQARARFQRRDQKSDREVDRNGRSKLRAGRDITMSEACREPSDQIPVCSGQMLHESVTGAIAAEMRSNATTHLAARSPREDQPVPGGSSACTHVATLPGLYSYSMQWRLVTASSPPCCSAQRPTHAGSAAWAPRRARQGRTGARFAGRSCRSPATRAHP